MKEQEPRVSSKLNIAARTNGGLTLFLAGMGYQAHLLNEAYDYYHYSEEFGWRIYRLPEDLPCDDRKLYHEEPIGDEIGEKDFKRSINNLIDFAEEHNVRVFSNYYTERGIEITNGESVPNPSGVVIRTS